MELWKAKRIQKRIDSYEKTMLKFEEYRNTVRRSIKRERKKLNKILKEMSYEDNLKFGNEMGFLDDKDYRKALSKVKK